LAFLEDGKAILSLGGQGDGYGELRLWDAWNGKQRSISGRRHLLAQAIATQGFVLPAALSPVSQQAAVSLAVAACDEAALRGTFRLAGRSLSMTFSRDGRWVALGYVGNFVELWEVRVLLSRLRGTDAAGE
jgi:hypothetical protein